MLSFDDWKDAHLLGNYPKKEVNIFEIPDIILKKFKINKDRYYFKNRQLELKHILDAYHWKIFFNPTFTAELGCGLGPRIAAMRILGMNCEGIEISEWAVNHAITPIKQGDITQTIEFTQKPDLIIAYDVLEHIEYDKLDFVIWSIYNSANKWILISIPAKGDKNLYADPTHKIFEDKAWWKNKFLEKGLKEIEIPNYLLFRDQLLIFEK